MQKRFLISLLSSILLLAGCIHTPLMKTVSVADANKIKLNERRFVNHPLKKLLREIKPDIKMVFARQTWVEEAGRFSFFFVDYDKYKFLQSKNKIPLRIGVWVKDTFQWDDKKRLLAKKLSWDKADTKQYGNLTVIALSIYGDYVDSLYNQRMRN